MNTAKHLASALIVLVAGILFVPSAWAQPRPYRGGFREGFELSTYLAFTDFDSKSEIDDDTGIGFRYGYLFNPNHEVEFMFNAISANDALVSAETVDMTNFQVAYVYNFLSHGPVPYLTAGLGVVHWDDSDLGTETDPVWALGGGLKLFMGRVLYARFELRHNMFSGDNRVFSQDENFSFNEFSAGVGWRFPTR